MSQQAAEAREPRAKLTTTIQALAKEFKVANGALFLESKTFKAWLKRGQGLPAAKREQYAEELLVLASKFYEFGGESAAKAVAQCFGEHF